MFTRVSAVCTGSMLVRWLSRHCPLVARSATPGNVCLNSRSLPLRRFSLTAMSCSSRGEEGEDSRRPLRVTRIFSDENGESHFGSFTIQMTGSGDIGHLSERLRCSGEIQFRLTPATYDYSWHTAPRRQFIVNLDGEVEISVSSGEKRILSRGEVFFVEDTTGKGHYSRAVNGCQRHSIFIPVPDDFLAQDC